VAYDDGMEILSPEDRIVLWRSAVEARGDQRRALVHVLAQDLFDALSALDLYSGEYARLTVESLETLDAAGLFARDSLRRSFEQLHEEAGGVEAVAAEISGLLREAAGVPGLGVDRRVRAVEMASQWREHVMHRQRPESTVLSVGDVAARFGVTTQAVYKWLQKGRIEATRGPGGSWRIPATQFARDTRPAASREQLDALQAHLTRLNGEISTAEASGLAERMRDEE
jgi:excisionase family DNA binding protein